MEIQRWFGLFLMAIALFCVCARQMTSSSADAVAAQLVNAFRQAHDHRSLAAMSRLYCWDNVTPEVRKLTENELKDSFKEKIVSVKVTTEHPKQRTNQYVRNGVLYRFNLPIVAELLVEGPALQKGSFSGTYYPLGMKGGQYFIAEMAPAKGKEVLPRIPSPGPANVEVKSPRGGDIKQPRQAAVVPANTLIVVRLQQDVGIKTIETGGHFSAVLDQSIVVNGATVLPSGTPAYGVVVKEHDYSPYATLTSIVVDGKHRKITTGQIIFNPEIVYPSDSQMAFTLLFPFDLK
jgi:hypothetical protein